MPLAVHTREHGFPRPRLRRRAGAVPARRGLIAGLIRFGRVSLYGADLLALGWWVGPELGTYAAARRLVFGLVALGLVVPASVAPLIAADGLRRLLARGLITDALGRLWTFSLPIAVGLGLTADRWMPLLFGASYQQGGPWLALVAARLPWLLTASFDQAALVPCRREAWVLDQMIGLVALAVLIIPSGRGPAGVPGGGLGGARDPGCRRGRRLAAPGTAGCGASVGSHGRECPCGEPGTGAGLAPAARDWPLWAVTLAAAAAYAVTWHAANTRWVSRRLRRGFAS